jgi:protein involved in polysaccharide export with SLBB domain
MRILALVLGIAAVGCGWARAETPSPPALQRQLQDLVPRGPQYVYGDDERVKISVNVWGEVERPGSYLVPDDTDLITLLSLAGGPTSTANLRSVELARFHAQPPGNRTLNLEKVLARPEVPPPGLLPGDIVQVPRRRAPTWGGVLRGFYELALVASTIVLVVDRVKE